MTQETLFNFKTICKACDPTEDCEQYNNTTIQQLFKTSIQF